MLTPYRVLDLTNERGLLCGQILGDLGADVIKIEPPGGSPARRFGPFFKDQPDPERSLFWWSYNRNKRGITLDLGSSRGRELFLRLAQSAHFLIESERPGAMAALGLGFSDLEKVNPALVYVSISAFGQDGPKALYEDCDLILMAAGGPLLMTGDVDRPPVYLSVPQAYLHASVEAAAAAMIAHDERQRSGRGQHVDVSAQQAVALATQSGVLAAPFKSAEMERMSGGVRLGPLNVRLVWPAKDGYVAITFLFGSALGIFTQRLMRYIWEQGGCDEKTRDKDWIAFGELMATGKEPISEYERVKMVVEEFTRTRTKADLLQAALERGLLIAPVTTIDEVVESPQLAARNYWWDVEYPELGRSIRHPGAFAKFSEKPLQSRRRAPAIGEHNREIFLDELGIGQADFAELQRKKVI